MRPGRDLPGLEALLADPVLAEVLAGRRDGLLLLDYDGTLAPFTPRRDEARPYPGVIEILARLPKTDSGRFAVVTGRPAATAAAFLAPARPWAIWGCHGAERLVPGQPSPLGPATAPETLAALDRAMALALTLAGREALESKPAGLALHWRGLPAEARQALEARVGPAWAELARQSGLALHPFDGGLELRLPGFHKGLAVTAMARDNPHSTLVYVGDDLTDEDAFQALGPDGVGVLAGRPDRPSAARYALAPPEELLLFLAAWAGAAAPRQPQPRSNHDE
ncbi:MAG: trehalose-phosphatase [Solidesulfovibrio magneticus str. Maddingley MBC34]|uniref:Trehalose 6-phosphate phosphatase n=1 Tax=Solidesulfovibrio magneticus str. Maddingley MBC34 TaxID=1206767 RepID=K6GP26_9BACT|nr:MAG: trehalose-phosphatase [Solidesulfovibrio magneticus str. Maddingley MBC34]